MHYQMYIENLTERILHIAKLEAYGKGHKISLSSFDTEVSTIDIQCNDEHFIPKLIATLNTQSGLNIQRLQTSAGEILDLKTLEQSANFPWLNQYTLSMLDKNSVGAVYM